MAAPPLWCCGSGFSGDVRLWPSRAKDWTTKNTKNTKEKNKAGMSEEQSGEPLILWERLQPRFRCPVSEERESIAAEAAPTKKALQIACSFRRQTRAVGAASAAMLECGLQSKRLDHEEHEEHEGKEQGPDAGGKDWRTFDFVGVASAAMPLPSLGRAGKHRG